MENYVVDSHTWLWFLTRNKELSSLAKQIIRQAEVGEAKVFIPTIVLAEIDNIIRKKKLELTIEQVLQRIVRGDGFAVASFDLAVFQVMITLPHNWEIHDKIIAATACFYEATLITRDEVLENSDRLTTLWS